MGLKEEDFVNRIYQRKAKKPLIVKSLDIGVHSFGKEQAAYDAMISELEPKVYAAVDEAIQAYEAVSRARN